MCANSSVEIQNARLQRFSASTLRSRMKRSNHCTDCCKNRMLEMIVGRLTSLRLYLPSTIGWRFRFSGTLYETPNCAPTIEGELRTYWPGRSRDYSLELPQIRACTLNAPGSSHCGIAVPHTTGWFRGDTLVRHGVLGVVPTPRPQRGTPFAPRGPGGPFPRLNTTMGHCDSLAAHLAALRFLRLAIPSLRPLFVPISSGLSWGSSWSF